MNTTNPRNNGSRRPKFRNGVGKDLKPQRFRRRRNRRSFHEERPQRLVKPVSEEREAIDWNSLAGFFAVGGSKVMEAVGEWGTKLLPETPRFTEKDRQREAMLLSQAKSLKAQRRDCFNRIRRNNRSRAKERWTTRRTLWNRTSMFICAGGFVGFCAMAVSNSASTVSSSMGFDSIWPGIFMSAPVLATPLVVKAFINGPLYRYRTLAETAFYTASVVGAGFFVLQFSLHYPPLEQAGAGVEPGDVWDVSDGSQPTGWLQAHFPSLWAAQVMLECAGSYICAKSFCLSIGPQLSLFERRIDTENDWHKEDLEKLDARLAELNGELAVLKARRQGGESLKDVLNQMLRKLRGK